MPAWFTEPGKGRRKCRHCYMFSSTRSKACSHCGRRWPIPRKRPAARSRQPTSNPTIAEQQRRILRATAEQSVGVEAIPAGAPPRELRSSHKAAVHQWAQSLVEDRPGLSLEALVYWARRSLCSPVSQKRAVSHLETWQRLYRRDEWKSSR